MSFHGAPRHLQLTGNLGVVTTLQKQFDDLLFARTEPNSLLLHPIPLFGIALPPELVQDGIRSIFHSTHIATLRGILSVTSEQSFPQAFAGIDVTLEKQSGLPLACVQR
jgi:hypothetical protein